MKVKLNFTRLQFEDIRLCFGSTNEQLSAFDKVKKRVLISTDVLILPIQFLDDLDFKTNTEITNAYQVSHETGSSGKISKTFVQYNFRRRRNRPKLQIKKDQEENKDDNQDYEAEETKEHEITQAFEEEETEEEEPVNGKVPWELTITVAESIQF